MHTVSISAAAEQDLLECYRYLRRNAGEDTAERLLTLYADAIGSLEQWPNRGSPPRELKDVFRGSVRQLLIAPYRLLYRVVGDEVRILMFADGRRDVAALMRARFDLPEED